MFGADSKHFDADIVCFLFCSDSKQNLGAWPGFLNIVEQSNLVCSFHLMLYHGTCIFQKLMIFCKKIVVVGGDIKIFTYGWKRRWIILNMWMCFLFCFFILISRTVSLWCLLGFMVFVSIPFGCTKKPCHPKVLFYQVFLF